MVEQPPSILAHVSKLATSIVFPESQKMHVEQYNIFSRDGHYSNKILSIIQLFSIIRVIFTIHYLYYL